MPAPPETVTTAEYVPAARSGLGFTVKVVFPPAITLTMIILLVSAPASFN